MNTIIIDHKKCIQCDICIDICPLKIIDKNKENKPFIIESKKVMCIRCGNCESFCPVNAISLDNNYTHPINEIEIDTLELSAYFVKRRSIRNYKSQLVNKNIIEDILNIVKYAPSARNIQPVNWLVIYDPENVKKIVKLTIDFMREAVKSDDENDLKAYMTPLIRSYDKGNDPICRDAPHLLIAYAAENNIKAYTDCVIALTWFELLAPSFGLGTCWAGFLKTASTQSKTLVDEFNLPNGYIFQHALMFGYPKYKVKNIPSRKKPHIIWKT